MNRWKKADTMLDGIISRFKPVKDDISRAWEKTGKESRKAEVITFKNGRLYLNVKNSVYLQELSYKKDMLIRTINDKIEGEKKVKDISFRLGGDI